MDWAEKEPDNDLTKNYPFPVPRIRDLPSEFRTDCCNLHSHSVPSAEEMSQYAAATNTEDAVSHDHDVVSLAVINTTDSSSHTSSDDEEAESKKRRLAHFSSDSKLQTAHHTKLTHHGNVSQSLHIPSPRKYRRTSRSRRLGSIVKSIVQKPPDASEQEVARARAQFKLFSKGWRFKMYVSELCFSINYTASYIGSLN